MVEGSAEWQAQCRFYRGLFPRDRVVSPDRVITYLTRTYDSGLRALRSGLRVEKLRAQAILELFAITTAECQPRAGPEQNRILPVQPGLKLLDSLHVDYA